jgi:hypothetical protein
MKLNYASYQVFHSSDLNFSFFQIDDIQISSTGINLTNSQIVVDLFIYTAEPLCESVRILFQNEKTIFHIRDNQVSSILLPYLKSNGSFANYLVSIVSMIGKEGISPFCYGYHDLPSSEEINSITISCSTFQADHNPFHFNNTKQQSILRLSISTQSSVEIDFQRTAKLCKSSATYPIDILSIFGIKVSFDGKSKPKSPAICFFLKKQDDQFITSEPVKTFLVKPSDSVFFPDIVSITLNNSLEFSLILYVELCKSVNRKEKVIASGSIFISKLYKKEKIELTQTSYINSEQISLECSIFFPIPFSLPNSVKTDIINFAPPLEPDEKFKQSFFHLYYPLYLDFFLLVLQLSHLKKLLNCKID